MTTTTTTLRDPDEVGRYVGDRLLDAIDAAGSANRRFLLGSPTGRTPKPIYAAMAQRLAKTKQDLSHVTLVMMDEYLVRAGSDLRYADAEWSCHNFVEAHIRAVLNAPLPSDRQQRRDAVWFADVRDPAEFDRRITEAGGVDFFILASGAGDGHVAFNTPGSPRDSRTRVVALPDSTRRDSLQTFPEFGTLDAVPRHGITVGVATIAAARHSMMVVFGSGKRQTYQRMTVTDRYDPAWPATLIHECPGGTIVADSDAAGPGR
ncbi:MAG TPA: 6-phosphogluconolactonase [Gemmatimonadaceae bacterium]|nr:6-phosphogluconolactonase [Gemmatimonadaceae bacterium]